MVIVENISPLAKGAEAEVYLTEFLGRKAIAKVRCSKRYRVPELDQEIRTSRTKTEARLMRETRKAGIRTPMIYDVDLKGSKIVMEEVKGKKVKDILDHDPSSAADICRMIGSTVADLHNNNISHGDLTTSNMILTDDGAICLIDMSMGRTAAELEDLGVDIRLLERAFASAHPKLPDAFSSLMSSYLLRVKEPDRLLKKLQEIKDRGRYT